MSITSPVYRSRLGVPAITSRRQKLIYSELKYADDIEGLTARPITGPSPSTNTIMERASRSGHKAYTLRARNAIDCT